MRVEKRTGLPKGIKVRNAITGEVVFQAFDFPQLPFRCEYCGSTEHLKKDCTVKHAWLTGAPVQEAAILSGFKGRFLPSL